MDAILLQIGHTVATYATLGVQGTAIVGFFLMSLLVAAMMDNPDITMIVCTLAAIAVVYHTIKPIRRVMRWYFIWPIGRMIHRLVRRPVRLLLGGIMARWKMSIVADKLDDALEKMCYDEHLISPQDYRRMSNTIGKALGLDDMVSKKTHPKGVERRVLENVALMKATPQVPGPPRTVDVDPSYNPVTGQVIELAFLRRRNTAA